MTSEPHTVTCECGFENSYEKETSAQAARAGHMAHCSEETVLNSDESVYFAYGSDIVDGCECPSVSAGFDTMKPAISKISGKYDDILFGEDEYRGHAKGVVSEKDAREAWLEVLDHFKSQDNSKPFQDAAESVAKELNWIE